MEFFILFMIRLLIILICTIIGSACVAIGIGLNPFKKNNIYGFNEDIENSQTYLSSMRSLYFPEFDDHNSYFIKEYAYEVFNLFVSVNSETVSTLQKIEKAIEGLKHDIELDEIKDIEEILDGFEKIDISLNQMIEVTDQLIDKYEITFNSVVNKEIQFEIDKKQLYEYVNIINNLSALAENHAILSWNFHKLLQNTYPEIIERYRTLSEKMIFLFYVNLVGCSTRIDSSISAIY